MYTHHCIQVHYTCLSVISDYFVMRRGAPDPDPAGYPVDLVDLVQIRIRPDPTSQDSGWIRIFVFAGFQLSCHTLNFRRLLPVSI